MIIAFFLYRHAQKIYTDKINICYYHMSKKSCQIFSILSIHNWVTLLGHTVMHHRAEARTVRSRWTACSWTRSRCPCSPSCSGTRSPSRYTHGRSIPLSLSLYIYIYIYNIYIHIIYIYVSFPRAQSVLSYHLTLVLCWLKGKSEFALHVFLSWKCSLRKLISEMKRELLFHSLVKIVLLFL